MVCYSLFSNVIYPSMQWDSRISTLAKLQGGFNCFKYYYRIFQFQRDLNAMWKTIKVPWHCLIASVLSINQSRKVYIRRLTFLISSKFLPWCYFIPKCRITSSMSCYWVINRRILIPFLPVCLNNIRRISKQKPSKMWRVSYQMALLIYSNTDFQFYKS